MTCRADVGRTPQVFRTRRAALLTRPEHARRAPLPFGPLVRENGKKGAQLTRACVSRPQVPSTLDEEADGEDEDDIATISTQGAQGLAGLANNPAFGQSRPVSTRRS